MKKKSLRIEIFVIVFILILAFAGVYYLNTNKKYDENLNRLELVEDVIDSSFLTNDTSLEEIEEVTEHDLGYELIVMGTDGFLRAREVDGDKYSSYIEVQNSCAETIENKFLNGTSYSVEESFDGNLSFEIRPWYFYTYVNDVTALTSLLLEMEGISRDEIYNDHNYDGQEYMATVKAMQIINNNLEYYENKDEIRYFTFYFENNKPGENQYLSLYFNLIGITSDYSVDNELAFNEQKLRLNNYIEAAKTEGILDQENPLKL